MSINKKRVWYEIVDFLKSVIISLIIVFLMTQFVIKPIRVDGSSMYPTLKDRQVGFSNIIALRFQEIERFDVVIVFVPQTNEHLVKRVIGLPNDTIKFVDDVLYVNGYPVEQPFLDPEYMNLKIKEYSLPNFTQDFGPVSLGENEYFLMGDNRPSSSDSRRFGPFRLSQIVSKDAYIIYPFNEMHLVINP